MKYQIMQDDFPWDPEEDMWSTIFTAHRRYDLSKEHATDRYGIECFVEEHREAIERAKDAGLYHEIFMYDHSGLAFSLDSPANWQHAAWDAGKVGFIYLDPERYKEDNAPFHGPTGYDHDTMEKILESEFADWAAYRSGDTYAVYALDDPDDEGIPLCSGTYADCMEG